MWHRLLNVYSYVGRCVFYFCTSAIEHIVCKTNARILPRYAIVGNVDGKIEEKHFHHFSSKMCWKFMYVSKMKFRKIPLRNDGTLDMCFKALVHCNTWI